MDFPALSSIIYLQQIYWGCGRRGGVLHPPPLPLHTELLLPSEPVSHYRCMNLPKNDDNYRTHKKIQIPYLDIWSMLLSGQVPHSSNSSHMFWNLEDLVLVQTVSYRRKITYHLLLIGFFHKLISMQDVGHMLHLHVAQQLPSLQALVSYLSYQWQLC